MKSLYVASAMSESGDHYGPYVFDKKPTDKQLKAFFKKQCSGEFEDGPGPGEWDSYLHVKISKVEVITLT